jgi:hypothetical protein
MLFRLHAVAAMAAARTRMVLAGLMARRSLREP